MFDPPERIQSEVFARLPDSLRLAGTASDWLDKQRKSLGPMFPDHSFLEGPAIGPDGKLYCVDIPFGRILRISPDGVFDVALQYDGNPNGLAFHRDGRAFIADNRRGILIADLAKGSIEPFVERLAMEALKGPNDLCFSSSGDLYFTDMGQTGLHDPSGGVYRIRADGHHDKLLGNVPGPNGIVLNANESGLFVAATRLNSIWTVPFAREDMPSKVGTFLHLQGGMGPDGLALLESGGLAVCHVGFGAVWVFSRRGEPLYRVEPPDGVMTSNLCFGGEDRKTLYITESQSGCILKAQLPEPGKQLFSEASLS
ncbi:MAG: SMP-30/gluconolactonase/LRE family protein [Pseudomonadota bacterium]